MDTQIKGSCLCGSVSYQFTRVKPVFQYCHCSRCRKFTGSVHAANIIVKPEQFEWLSGEPLVARFEHPEAKHFATSFCKSCGSSLPWLTQSKGAVVIPAGTLDDDPGIEPSQNIYWQSRVSWQKDTCDLPQYDETPGKN